MEYVLKMKQFSIIIFFAPLLALTLSCAKKSSTAAGTGSGGSSSVAFTASDIAKTWTSVCRASTDSITGATHFQGTLNLESNGVYSYGESWYFNPSGSEGECSPVDYA